MSESQWDTVTVTAPELVLDKKKFLKFIKMRTILIDMKTVSMNINLFEIE